MPDDRLILMHYVCFRFIAAARRKSNCVKEVDPDQTETRRAESRPGGDP